jgi:hypothetical protein
MVRASGLNDVDFSQILSNLKRALSHDTFKDLNYTESHFLRDWKQLLDLPPNERHFFGQEMWTDKLKDGNQGAIAEVAIAAKLKRDQKKVLEIGADETGGSLPNGSKVDISTDTELYQVGINGGTIRNKLKDEPEVAAAGIKLALDADTGKRYKFAYIDDPNRDFINIGDETGPEYYSRVLNDELKILYGDATPPQIFNAADFVKLNL